MTVPNASTDLTQIKYYHLPLGPRNVFRRLSFLKERGGEEKEFPGLACDYLRCD